MVERAERLLMSKQNLTKRLFETVIEISDDVPPGHHFVTH
jgi:hypothetical protein